MVCSHSAILAQNTVSHRNRVNTHTVAMSRRDQLAQLDAWRRKLPHVSQSALAAIVAEARNATLPETTVSRWALATAQSQVLRERTPYGTVGQTLKLQPTAPRTDTINLTVVYLPAFLHLAFASCEEFRNFMLARHDTTPSSAERPWRLVIYADEYNPGRELAMRHARKQWMTYATFLEFGAFAIEREELWFAISAALTSIVADIESGLANWLVE